MAAPVESMVDGVTAWAVVSTIAILLGAAFHLGGLIVFDVKQLEADAKAEVDAELAAAAKARIKGKLKEIAAARRVVANLEADYAAIMRDVGSA